MYIKWPQEVEGHCAKTNAAAGKLPFRIKKECFTCASASAIKHISDRVDITYKEFQSGRSQ